MKQQQGDSRRLATVSILLALLALVGAVSATAAWISIADNARVRNLSMDVTAGKSLRFDLDPHEEFSQYVETLTTEEIYARCMQDYGISPDEQFLTPVTTEDTKIFTLRNGDEQTPETGAYLEFVLHFMATEDMLVHLTSNNSEGHLDGTLISSTYAQLPDAMRISFTHEEQTAIYDPGATQSSQLSENCRIFFLPSAGHTVYNDENSLFFLKANTDTPVTVHIWMEGTDAACTDEIKGGDFSIRLRFIGTNMDHTPIQ